MVSWLQPVNPHKHWFIRQSTQLMPCTDQVTCMHCIHFRYYIISCGMWFHNILCTLNVHHWKKSSTAFLLRGSKFQAVCLMYNIRTSFAITTFLHHMFRGSECLYEGEMHDQLVSMDCTATCSITTGHGLTHDWTLLGAVGLGQSWQLQSHKSCCNFISNRQFMI